MPQIALKPTMAPLCEQHALRSSASAPRRHDLAATTPGIVPKAADFSPVNRRIFETNEPFAALSDQ